MKDLSSEMTLAVVRLVPSFSVANDVAKGTYSTHTHTHTDTYECCACTHGHAQTLPLFDETVLIFLIGLLAFSGASHQPESWEAGVACEALAWVFWFDLCPTTPHLVNTPLPLSFSLKLALDLVPPR